MNAVLRCIYERESCLDALRVFLREGDINVKDSSGMTLLCQAVHVHLNLPSSSMKNIDLLLQHGADPHPDSSFGIAASWGNLGLVKLFLSAPKFDPAHLRINAMNYKVNSYLTVLNDLYKRAEVGGVPFLLKMLTPRLCWPIPGILVKALTPADRALLKRLAEDQLAAPRSVRSVFFNKESSAQRLPTAVARYISGFAMRSAAEISVLREYARLLN